MWSRSVAELRRVQPRTTVVSRQRMILQRCWNKTIRRDQTYNIAASSSLSYCDLPRRALSSLKTSSSSSLERQQRQKLRKPTFQDVIYFQSILSNPHKSILTTLKPDNDNNSSKNSTSYENTATNADNDAHAKEKLSIYNTDWTNQYHGSSKLVLRPSSTHEISSILHYCHTNYIPIVPHGGNTGLCGGATPLIPPQDDDNNNNSSSNSSHNEIILSLEYMNNIYNIDIYSGILTCDAGVILQSLHDYAHKHKYIFPLDVGSKGSCQIGGNVATNAGGQYFNRFGGLHSTVVGMEVVLPTGEVMNLNMQNSSDIVENGSNGSSNVDTTDGGEQRQTNVSTPTTINYEDHTNTKTNMNRYITHRKDNTGYDVKHLFIGSEGTLGIVTKVAIACPPAPSTKNVVILVCKSYENVLHVLQCAKVVLGEILSALELMDYDTLNFVHKHGHSGGDDGGGGSRLLHDILLQSNPSYNIQQDSEEALPLPSSSSSSSTSRPVYLLVETQGSNIEHDIAKMNTFLEQLHDRSIITSGFLAQSLHQVNEMWSIRESCNPCVAKAGCVYKFDISIPVEEYMDITYEIESKLRTNDYCSNMDFTVCVWGHVSDGNAHINIVTPGQHIKDGKLATIIDEIVYDSVIHRFGSISAEHGLGQSKNEVMGLYKERITLDVMQQIKDTFDPHGIMNPGKYLPKRN